MDTAEPSSSVVSAETLTNMLSLSSENRVYSEGRTEYGYISLFSWREVFVWLPAGLGKRSVSKRFRFCSTGGTLGWDS